MRPSLVVIPILWAALLSAACHRDGAAKKKAEFERVRAAYEKKLAEQERARAASEQRAARPTPVDAGAPRRDNTASPPAPVQREDAPWIADSAVELAAPAQATASARGIIVNTREGDVLVAHLGRLRGGAAHETDIEPLPHTTASFGLGYGPSVAPGYVYFISRGSLVRRKFPAHGPPGPLEVLARDAFDGTRVAVPIPVPGKRPPPIPPAVAYVVRPEKEGGPLIAKLWLEGQEPEVLTAEGNSTHSVALVQTGDGLLALSVQARMAMTPVHARRVRFASGRPLLGDDTVVWVGGGIQPLTEMTVLPTESGLAGLIPHERSMSEFGLARLDIGQNPTMDTPTTWMLYPNGIDPAPVAAAELCGEPVFLYAVPQTAAPDSPQELLVRALSDASGDHALRVATGRAFYFASLAEIPGGALAAWVTDSATSACTVRCRPQRK